METSTEKPERRYDIDWLRVILFGLLIPFHVAIGVYWSTYGEGINPNITDDPDERLDIADEGNDYTAESIDPASMFLHWMHQWRLAALFMISGMGTAFAFKRRTWGKFLIERLQRLLVPMFFGMWTVGFIGGILTGAVDLEGNTVTDSIIAFILHVLFTSFVFWVPLFGKIIALGHLWFLWNLFLYSLLCVPIFHYVQKNPNGGLAKKMRASFTIKGGLGIFIVLPLILTLTEIMFKPWFPGLIGIGYEWFWYLVFFLFGYICIISREEYYTFIDTNRNKITGLTILFTIGFVLIRIKQHSDGVAYMDGGWFENGIIHNQMTIFGCFIHSFHAWFWCLTVFAWGAHFMNKPSKHLSYLNQGVYPFYIIHMPITFAGLRVAKEFDLTNIPAVLFGCVFVTVGCWIAFEIVRRTKVTRYLFGIKSIK
ncbi:MAG: acyltransferase family protein [Candidatus Poseidoniaceae archaeon]|jgi:hypothetical protein|nr:acyltransferase family protein [Candidatus Poseidoniaceae archaeon]